MNPELVRLLVCPKTGEPLHLDSTCQKLVAVKARIAYPIRDGIPVLMTEEARPLDDTSVSVAKKE
jgi:uncharacterized protein YbaR (Trm112 family)